MEASSPTRLPSSVLILINFHRLQWTPDARVIYLAAAQTFVLADFELVHWVDLPDRSSLWADLLTRLAGAVAPIEEELAGDLDRVLSHGGHSIGGPILGTEVWRHLGRDGLAHPRVRLFRERDVYIVVILSKGIAMHALAGIDLE